MSLGVPLWTGESSTKITKKHKEDKTLCPFVSLRGSDGKRVVTLVPALRLLLPLVIHQPTLFRDSAV